MDLFALPTRCGGLACQGSEEKRENGKTKNTDFISPERNEKIENPYICREKEYEKPSLPEMKKKRHKKTRR